MKCKNCGASNPSGALKCQECNVPLTGSMLLTGDDLPRVQKGTILCKNCKTENPATALRCSKCNAPFDGSLAIRPEEIPALHATQKMQDNKDQWELKDCPSCGYPNKSIADNCVSCGEALYPTTKSNNPTQEKQETKPTVKSAQAVNKNATINPWVDAAPSESNTFVLEPLDAHFQSMDKKLAFDGAEVDLNRANLEKDNATITQKTQASISRKDGQWVLNDKSEMKTTFIKTGADHPLNDGDILLMGNRLFRFSANND
jgi:ribosomal protein L40E